MKEVNESTSFAIIQVARKHRQRVEEALNELGLHTGQEFLLLQLWQEEGLTPTQLANIACVEPPTISKMLQRLERVGLIERKSDAEDARVSRVYLTEQGRSLEKPVLRALKEVNTHTVKGLTDVEQALLRRLLNQVADNLSEKINYL